MTVPDRAKFWEALADRLTKLSNRIELAEIRAQVIAKVPKPSKKEIDLENLREYLQAWEGVAAYYAPRREYEPTPMKKALRSDSDALKAMERKKAMTRVEAAKGRIARVERGEDAGLKKPFSVDDPNYVAAVKKIGGDIILCRRRGSQARSGI
jgi:hypothetical protein